MNSILGYKSLSELWCCWRTILEDVLGCGLLASDPKYPRAMLVSRNSRYEDLEGCGLLENRQCRVAPSRSTHTKLDDSGGI